MATEGLKNDQEKPRMDLVPAGATTEIAKVFTFGAKKYADNNWRKGFKYSRLVAALERHIAAFKEGEDMDPESKLYHMGHAGCCVMMLLEHQLKDYGVDDRYMKLNEKEQKIMSFLPHQYPIFYDVITDQRFIVINGERYNGTSDLAYWINPVNYIVSVDNTTRDYYGEGIYKTIFSGSGFVEISPTW